MCLLPVELRRLYITQTVGIWTGQQQNISLREEMRKQLKNDFKRMNEVTGGVKKHQKSKNLMENGA